MDTETTRRKFIRNAALAASTLAAGVTGAQQPEASMGKEITARDYLKTILNTREGVDCFLDDASLLYDRELGWRWRDYRAPAGVDGSVETCRFMPNGARMMVNYRDKACRINTYGDSFTQCQQTSDGETWQEVLAAHLCEPLRNYGIGGYSVYQSYLRARREEAKYPADYIILNIYDDDHYRNIEPWWCLRWGKHPGGAGPTLPYLKVDSGAGTFEECVNTCVTPQSLYDLCDLDWVEERFRDDFVLGIVLEHMNAREQNPDVEYHEQMKGALTSGVVTGINRGKTISRAAEERHTRAALFASMKVVELMEHFAKACGKKVLYVLSFNSDSIARAVETGSRYDQPFVDFLEAKGLPYVDLLDAHVQDFKDFSTPLRDYLQRYYIRYYTGHYAPLGNFFTAFAIKDKLVEMLVPKPPAYAEI